MSKKSTVIIHSLAIAALLVCGQVHAAPGAKNKPSKCRFALGWLGQGILLASASLIFLAEREDDEKVNHVKGQLEDQENSETDPSKILTHADMLKIAAYLRHKAVETDNVASLKGIIEFIGKREHSSSPLFTAINAAQLTEWDYHYSDPDTFFMGDLQEFVDQTYSVPGFEFTDVNAFDARKKRDQLDEIIARAIEEALKSTGNVIYDDEFITSASSAYIVNDLWPMLDLLAVSQREHQKSFAMRDTQKPLMAEFKRAGNPLVSGDNASVTELQAKVLSFADKGGVHADYKKAAVLLIGDLKVYNKETATFLLNGLFETDGPLKEESFRSIAKLADVVPSDQAKQALALEILSRMEKNWTDALTREAGFTSLMSFGRAVLPHAPKLLELGDANVHYSQGRPYQALEVVDSMNLSAKEYMEHIAPVAFLSQYNLAPEVATRLNRFNREDVQKEMQWRVTQTENASEKMIPLVALEHLRDWPFKEKLKLVELALKDPSPDVVQQSMVVLQAIGRGDHGEEDSQKVISLVGPILASDELEVRHINSIGGVLNGLGEEANKLAPGLAQFAIKNQDNKNIASTALSQLQKMGSNASQATPLIVEQLKSTESDIQENYVRTLSSILPADYDAYIPLGIKGLSSINPNVRAGSAHVLQRFGSRASGAIDGLVENLSYEDITVQNHSAQTLGSQGFTSKKAVKPLVQLMLSDYESVQSNARQALVNMIRLDNSILDAVIGELADTKTEKRRMVINVIQAAGADAARAIEPLEKIKGTDSNWKVREDASRAINAIKGFH